MGARAPELGRSRGGGGRPEKGKVLDVLSYKRWDLERRRAAGEGGRDQNGPEVLGASFPVTTLSLLGGSAGGMGSDSDMIGHSWCGARGWLLGWAADSSGGTPQNPGTSSPGPAAAQIPATQMLRAGHPSVCGPARPHLQGGPWFPGGQRRKGLGGGFLDTGARGPGGSGPGKRSLTTRPHETCLAL